MKKSRNRTVMSFIIALLLNPSLVAQFIIGIDANFRGNAFRLVLEQ